MAGGKKKKELPNPYAPTAADALRFARLSEEIIHTPWGNGRTDEGAVGGIGTLGEKRLHATVKRYLCEDVACHERLVGDMAAEVDEAHKAIAAAIAAGDPQDAWSAAYAHLQWIEEQVEG